ncbi:putative diphosphomevalonate decarboxylase [Helianthus debilis subsp. tardiflorus]
MDTAVAARTPANIALIRDNISVSLDPNHLCTTTTVSASPSFDQDRMWLNGEVIFFSLAKLMNVRIQRRKGREGIQRVNEQIRHPRGSCNLTTTKICVNVPLLLLQKGRHTPTN